MEGPSSTTTRGITPAREGCYHPGVLFLPLSFLFVVGSTGPAFVHPILSLVVPAARAEGGANPPVSEAGLGVFAYVGDTVILNGEASSDPDGQPLSYAWTQTSGPPVALVDATSARPSFVVTDPGTVRVQLIVSDGALYSGADSVAVIIPDREAQPLGEDGGCASAGAPSRSSRWWRRTSRSRGSSTRRRRQG